MNAAVRLVVFALAWAAAAGPVASAEPCGKLCDFERQATSPSPPPKASGKEKHRGDHSDDEGIGSLLIRPFAEVFLVGIAEGGANSSLRANGGSETVRARNEGEALIPRLRIDASAQRVDEATNGRDLRIEAGHGALGIQARLTRYREDVQGAPAGVAHLDFRQAHLLYRMAGEVLEVDLGAGLLQMSGRETRSAFSFTVPVLIHPLPWLGFEYRPAWSTIADNLIRDQEVAIVLGGPYAALRLGYRRIDSEGGSGGAVLQGPFAGLSVRF